jgi:hypothetical protein
VVGLDPRLEAGCGHEISRRAEDAPAPRRHRGSRSGRGEPPTPAGANNTKDLAMFFLFGRRFPVLALLIGAALLIVGAVTHDIRFDVVGGLGLLVGGYRCVTAARKRGIAGVIGTRSRDSL